MSMIRGQLDTFAGSELPDRLRPCSLGIGLGLGLGIGSGGGGGGSGVATMVSAASRSRVAMTRAVQVNPVSYFRNYERPARNLTGIRGIFSNIAVQVGFANAETGTRCTSTIRGSMITNLSGIGINQSAATTTVSTFSDAKNNVTFVPAPGAAAMGCIWFVNRAVTPNTCTQKTYTEFQAAGGAITSSTVNGGSVANTMVDVPDGYIIITDAGPDVTANTPYFAQLEVQTPVIVVTGIVAGTGTMDIATASNISKIQIGDLVTVASATGNTSVNGLATVTAVGSGVITASLGSAVTGVVTGTPTARFFALAGQVVASRTINNLGDFARGSATVQDFIGNGNWTGLGANGAADGTAQNGWTAIIGTDPSGGKGCIGPGDSIIAEVRDGNSNNPASTLVGDVYGNLAFLNRAMGAGNYPMIRIAVPGMSDGFAAYGDDSMRLWLANFADTAIIELGHNYGPTTGTYASFASRQTNLFTRWRNAGRISRIVATTQTPTTTSSDLWVTRGNQTATAAVAFFYSTYNPNLLNSTFLTGAAGGVDATIDIAQIIANLDGGALNTWAVNGTNYWSTTDGTHPSMDGHINIATALISGIVPGAVFGSGAGNFTLAQIIGF